MGTKRLFRQCMFLFAVLLITPVLAQQTIKGTVIDGETGQPIPGVTVLVKGTTNGTSADFDGNYNITASNDAVLIFSSIGYNKQEIAVGSRSTIDITLNVDNQQLDEVVVVGYGTQSTRKVTGSVQQIDTDVLSDLPVAQVTQKLQGRLVGVQINQTTGKPGQGLQVRIRGQASILAGSDPLYVVDGFPIIGDIGTINPDEIESITVLKDAASTSLYGSRAANGVVLITTKSGKTEQGGFSFSYFGGIQNVPQKGRPDLMNGTEFAQFKKESFEDLGQPVPEPFQNPESYGEGYDWYGSFFRPAPIQSYNLNWNSRTERSSVAIVAGLFNQEGVAVNSDFKRYSLRANSTFKLNDDLNLGFSVAPTYSINNLPSTDGAFYATNANAAIPGGLLTNAAQTWPIFPIKNADGSLTSSSFIPGISAFPTPNWLKAAKEITNEEKRTRILGNLYLNYQPIKG